MIAIAGRPRQLPVRLSASLERAFRDGELRQVEVGALTWDEARQLIGGSVAGRAADALYAESGGNPFYLEQLARAPLPTDGRQDGGVSLSGVEVPWLVAAALAEEFALLGDTTRRVLDGASVAGDPFEPELAATAAAVPEDDALPALDELLQRDLIRPTEVPRRFRFRHPLVRAAIYDRAPGAWRLGAHERCAASLAARGAPAAERAHHVERSARHGDTAAVAVLREAARAAAQRAPVSAARLCAAALRVLPGTSGERVELLSELAAASSAAGRFEEAHAAVLDALAAVPEDDAAGRLRLTARCAVLEGLLGRHQQAHARVVSALDGLAGERSAAAVELMLVLGLDAFYRRDYAAMRDWTRDALDVARDVGDRPLTAAASSTLVLASLLAGDVPGALEQREEAACTASGGCCSSRSGRSRSVR